MMALPSDILTDPIFTIGQPLKHRPKKGNPRKIQTTSAQRKTKRKAQRKARAKTK